MLIADAFVIREFIPKLENFSFHFPSSIENLCGKRFDHFIANQFRGNLEKMGSLQDL